MILRPTSSEQTTFCTFETKMGNVWSSALGKKIFPPITGKQTLALVVKFTSVAPAAVQLKFLVWKSVWMNLKVLEKPSTDILKSWLFPIVRSNRSPLHEVKTDKKSQCMEKQEVSNYTWHTVRLFYFCKFVAFSIFLQTWTVWLGGFFYHWFSIIYAGVTKTKTLEN